MTIHGGDRSIARTSPQEIATNPLYTNREKIDLLRRLKSEVTGRDANPDKLAFDPAEIDSAIEGIELEMQRETHHQPTIFGGGL